jgi:hypothetical protein
LYFIYPLFTLVLEARHNFLERSGLYLLLYPNVWSKIHGHMAVFVLCYTRTMAEGLLVSIGGDFKES